MKYDPLYLFENKPEKFKKFLRKRMGNEEALSDEKPSKKGSLEVKKESQNPPTLIKAVSAPV